MSTTYWYVLCQCGHDATALTKDGETLIYTSRAAAEADAWYMRRLMEGGPRTRYSVRAAR